MVEPVQETTVKKPTVIGDQTEMFLSPKDSSGINSVCKFNFIFYFIYKLKYDEEPYQGELIELEL